MAYRVAGSNVAPRVAGGQPRGGVPVPRPPRLQSSSPGNQPAGFRDVSATMRPGSPQYEAIAQMVRAQFGDLADVPEDTPLASFLKMSGFADATPGLFPEREQRQALRRGALAGAADSGGGLSALLGGNGTGGSAATGAEAPTGAGALPPRISTQGIVDRANRPPPPRIGALPEPPPRIGGVDPSKFQGLGGTAPTAAAIPSALKPDGVEPLGEQDPLMQVYRRIMAGGR